MPDAASLLTPAQPQQTTNAISTQVVEREGIDDPKKRLLFVGILIASVFVLHKFKRLFK